MQYILRVKVSINNKIIVGCKKFKIPKVIKKL